MSHSESELSDLEKEMNYYRQTAQLAEDMEHLKLFLKLEFDDLGKWRTRTDMRLDRLERKLDRHIEHTNKRFEQIDKRFDQIDKKFEQVDQRFERVEGDIGTLKGDVRRILEILENK